MNIFNWLFGRKKKEEDRRVIASDPNRSESNKYYTSALDPNNISNTPVYDSYSTESDSPPEVNHNSFDGFGDGDFGGGGSGDSWDSGSSYDAGSSDDSSSSDSSSSSD